MEETEQLIPGVDNCSAPKLPLSALQSGIEIKFVDPNYEFNFVATIFPNFVATSFPNFVATKLNS